MAATILLMLITVIAEGAKLAVAPPAIRDSYPFDFVSATDSFASLILPVPISPPRDRLA
jgi:hypothetical protein